ncbi:hypothetical protein M404DRAFT_1000614 [Pisolithus tinctorius Marx 270]|uniref:Uncharacterized protein n=1 Tax=Pisolithus tinctorius Marx 270 TaxID=870435 RepID=A0A0C3PA93_PISTI|nr:hypothetical protein M404DRAFT_1000614 [Pisolithus tinctorius Marx 270]
MGNDVMPRKRICIEGFNPYSMALRELKSDRTTDTRTHRPLSFYVRRSGSKNLVRKNHEFAASEMIHLTHSEWGVGCLTSSQMPYSIIPSCTRKSRRN